MHSIHFIVLMVVVFHIKTKLYCYLLLKIAIFNTVEKMLYFFYCLMFYQKYFEIHFISDFIL